MLKKVALAVAAALAAQAASAASIDYHGYFRAGTGVNVDGGSQVCYGNGGPNAHPVGRLGDECDMYAEMNFGATVAKTGDQVWKVFSTIAYGTAESGDVPQMSTQGNSWQQIGTADSPWDGSSRLSVREMYAQATGVFADSTIWMGKRFGQRRDIHILDFFTLMNSGYGAGFDGLSVGPGKLSFAYTQGATGTDVKAFPDYDWAVGGDDQNVVDGQGKTWLRTNKFELRYGFEAVKGHSVELIGIYGKTSPAPGQESVINGEDGFFLSGELNSSILGGFNKAILQYGTNGFGIMRGNFGGLDYAPWFGEGSGWRFVDHGTVALGSSVDLAYAFIFGEDDPDDVKGNGWFASDYTTVVVRPVFKWNDTISTAVEVGYDTVTYENAAHQGRIGGEDLLKVTVAQQWSPLASGGGIWAKPSFRLFVSNYSGDRAVDKAETMIGTQVEAWW